MLFRSNDTATTEIYTQRYTLSLHDALPIYLAWMTTDKPVWFVAEYLLTIFHYRLLTAEQAKRLHRVDKRLFRAECLERAVK